MFSFFFRFSFNFLVIVVKPEFDVSCTGTVSCNPISDGPEMPIKVSVCRLELLFGRSDNVEET